jgi:HJR/Mrr/RecB family endonuclease
MYYDLNKQQQALASLMSDISEEGWAAGWMDGLEYALWHMVLHGPARYGFKFVDEQTIQQLKFLSEQAGCWIVFDDVTDERAVSLPDWQQIFQAANPADFHLGMPDID